MWQCVVRVMGAPPPWGQSLLRSCLASHSFPPPPPRDALSAVGSAEMLILATRYGPPLKPRDVMTSAGLVDSFQTAPYRKRESAKLAKPHQARVGAGRSAQ